MLGCLVVRYRYAYWYVLPVVTFSLTKSFSNCYVKQKFKGLNKNRWEHLLVLDIGLIWLPMVVAEVPPYAKTKSQTKVNWKQPLKAVKSWQDTKKRTFKRHSLEWWDPWDKHHSSLMLKFLSRHCDTEHTKRGRFSWRHDADSAGRCWWEARTIRCPWWNLT